MRKVARLTPWQWWVLLSAPFVLLQTAARLWFGGLSRTLASVRRPVPSILPEHEQLRLGSDTTLALAAACRYGPWRPRCLVRSVALARYLVRKGIACEVRIGIPSGKASVSTGGSPDFSAHAWVECCGSVLNDRDDVAARYTAFSARSVRF